MVGRGEFGSTMSSPLPGMAKVMTLSLSSARAFTAAMASRSVHSVASHVPVPGSALEFTTSGGGSRKKHAENSEVLPSGAVAVMLSTVPGGSGSDSAVRLKLSLVVFRARDWSLRRCPPSPWPLASQEELAYSARR